MVNYDKLTIKYQGSNFYVDCDMTYFACYHVW